MDSKFLTSRIFANVPHLSVSIMCDNNEKQIKTVNFSYTLPKMINQNGLQYKFYTIQ